MLARLRRLLSVVYTRRPLEYAGIVIDALTLFGIPTLTMVFIAWAADGMIDHLPVNEKGEHDPFFAFEAIFIVGVTALLALFVARALFKNLRRLSRSLDARLHAVDEGSDPPRVASGRIRVGRLVRRRGIESVREIERKYRPLD